MIKIIRKIFQSLSSFWKKRQRKDGEIPGLDEIFKEILNNNLALITEESMYIGINRINLEGFERAIDKHEKGIIYCTFYQQEQYPFMVFLPEGYLKTMVKAFREKNRLPNTGKTLLSLVQKTAGYIPRLFYFTTVTENDTASYKPGFFFSLMKRYSEPDREEMLWKVSDCEIFDLSIGQEKIYFLVNKELLQKIEILLDQDSRFRRAVRNFVLANSTETTEEEKLPRERIGIKIIKQREFIIGDFFIPRNAICGGNKIISRFTEILDLRDYHDIFQMSGFWMKFGIKTEKQDYPFFYFLETESSDLTKPNVEKLFACFVHYNLGFFKEKLPPLSGKPYINRIDNVREEEIKKTIVLKAFVKTARLNLDCFVFIPVNFLNLMCSYLLEPWEMEYLKDKVFSGILNLLSLNQSLFRKSIRTFYQKRLIKKKDRTIRPAGGYAEGEENLLLYELINLLEDRDVKLIVQNFLSGSAQKIGNVFEYFYFLHKVRSANREGLKIASPLDFNKERVFKMLPSSILNQWRDLPRLASKSYYDFIRVNIKAMKTLFKEVNADRLALSYKARFLLTSEFYNCYDLMAKEKLKALIRQKIPFMDIKTVRKQKVQQLLSFFKTRQLALALIEAEEFLYNLKEYLSRRHFLDLKAEYQLVKRQFRNRSVSSEEVYQAKMSLHEKLTESKKE
jgi:hypothetical protein